MISKKVGLVVSKRCPILCSWYLCCMKDMFVFFKHIPTTTTYWNMTSKHHLHVLFLAIAIVGAFRETKRFRSPWGFPPWLSQPSIHSFWCLNFWLKNTSSLRNEHETWSHICLHHWGFWSLIPYWASSLVLLFFRTDVFFSLKSLWLSERFCRTCSSELHLPRHWGSASKDMWNETIPNDIRLMEEILHQLIGRLSHYFQGFIHPRWCRI